MVRPIKWLLALAVPALFVLALGALARELRTYHLADIRAALTALPTWRVLAAIALTLVSYAVLTLYDRLGLVYAGKRLSSVRVAFASFSAYVFSYNIGFSVLGGAAVRYRLYTGWGLSALEIGRVVLFAATTFWLGMASVAGGVFVLGFGSAGLPWPPALLRALGVSLLLLVAAYLTACFRRPGDLRLRGFELTLPTPRLACAQLGLGVVDVLLAGLVLFALFPGSDVSLGIFLGAYLVAITAGLISHVPGGLGVFETVLLLTLPTQVPRPELMAMLVAFRVIYYLCPFLLGLTFVGVYAAVPHRRRIVGVAGLVSKGVASITPRALTYATFLAGVVLLASGATPAVQGRLEWLRDIFPLGLLEISHFLASLAGVALLFLARGLQLRLNAAWAVTLALLGAGSALSLAKGLDYEEATALALAGGALALSRKHFRRRSSLWDQRYSPGWIATIGVVLAGTTWLGFFAHKHVEYSNELWWSFEFSGHAPRFLRASVGASALLVVIGLAHLFRPARHRPPTASPEEVKAALELATSGLATGANLVALGDKAILFSESRRSFLRYGVTGRSWVALGDPIGEAEEAEELVWEFRERCEEAGVWTVFYEVSGARLSLYVDLGLSLFKLGEEARVPLATFSLEGGARKGLRKTRSRAEAEGCAFSVWEPEEVRVRLAELKAVSDAWLRQHNTREKSFSLGSFESNYVGRFPAGIVTREGAVLAFATLWRSGGKEEFSVDLMRQLPDAPAGTMDYLFIRLLLLAKEQGFRWFNLGMAPFSGIERHPLAPLWNRMGALLFRHGEHFYNFRGLRQYKEKFGPVWEPKYLACPGGLILPRVLANVSALVSGGLAGLIRK